MANTEGCEIKGEPQARSSAWLECHLRQYDECAERVAAGTANPLDVFIAENEPAGHAASDKFRAELEAAIKWLAS